MWLKARDDPLHAKRPRGRERGGHLGRVVGVVVVDLRPARGAPARFEPPAGSREAAKRVRGLGEREPGLAAGREGPEGVEDVVSPRDAELDRDARHREARPPRYELDLLRRQVARLDPVYVRPSAGAWEEALGSLGPDQDRRRALDELRHRLLELR